MHYRIMAWAVLLGLSGCAPVAIVDQTHEAAKAGNQPLFDQPSTVTAGSVLFHQYSYWHRQGARITVANRQPFAQGALFIMQGEILYPGTIGPDHWWCSAHETYVDPLVGFMARSCFQDTDQDGEFDQVAVAPDSQWIRRKLSPTLAYKTQDITQPHPGGFRYELAYDGYSHQTLQLSFRDYHGDTLERPGYTQQVSYEIKQFPAEILFRTVKIQIVQADNQHLVYRVLSGF